ncbi:MAG: hypothetical protein K8H84_03555 [Sulfuricella denitrificans]|nr:hypothetical protein [Sulfuricella denitrificans]
MRNVPSMPPVTPAIADEVVVRPVSYLRAAKVVGERDLTPLVFSLKQPSNKADMDAFPGTPSSAEHRRETERRSLCRRIASKGMGPYDTRAAEERRSGNRRASDITTQIEENI